METPNVVVLVDEALSADIVDRMGETAGAAQEARGPAVKAAVPGVFQALGRRARDPAGAAEIVGAIRETSPAATLNNPVLAIEAEPPLRQATAERVLGEERGPLVGRVAEHSGATEETASAVVAMVVPLALGALARTVSVPLGQETLLRLFREQQRNIDRADPFTPAHAATGDDMHDATPGGRRKKSYLWAWIIGIALLAVLFFGLRTCGFPGSEPTTETTLAPSTAGEAPTTATVPVPEPTTPQTPPAAGASPDTPVSSPPAQPAG